MRCPKYSIKSGKINRACGELSAGDGKSRKNMFFMPPCVIFLLKMRVLYSKLRKMQISPDRRKNFFMKIDSEKFGAVPFWFWNGDQQEAEITRQLELAKAGGWRGMTLHARVGNQTEYLSERWMALFRHACVEAKRLGLEIWLYDEEGFPSGSIGGRLPALGEKYQQKRLMYEVRTAKEARAEKDLFCCFSKEDPAAMVSPEDVPDDMRLLVFRRVVLDYFVDYLSTEASAMFLQMTHEKYADALGEFFGNVIPVVYTDDIQYMFGNGYFVWTDGLEEIFSARFGYGIRENLSALVENLPSSAKVRHDFRCLVTDLLNVNFVRPMAKWSKEHNMIFTGHLCCDEGPLTSMIRSFGDPSAFYMEEDIPGVDDYLTGNQDLTYMTEPRNTFPKPINGVQGFPITTLCKQASSISSQFKDGKCSSEVLTSLGWGVPVYNQMAQIDFEILLGVNIIVHHDCSYTTEGLTKRDHPASFFFQQPYFAVNKALYAPVNNTLALMSRGKMYADVLVLHPVNAANLTEDGVRIMADGHGESDVYPVKDPLPQNTRDAHFLTAFLQELNLALLRKHISFEYGFERIMAQYASIEDGRIRIGDSSYSTVIVPGFTPVEEKVKELLKRFEQLGGTVITLTGDLAALPETLDADLAGKLPAEVAVGTRIVNGRKEHYLVNYGNGTATVTLDSSDVFEIYDPERNKILVHSGKTFRMPRLSALHLLPEGTLEDVEKQDIARTPFAPEDPAGEIVENTHWTVTPENENIFVLDRGTDENGKLTLFDGVEHWGGEYRVEVRGISGKTKFFFEKDAASIEVNGETVSADPAVHHAATQALCGTELELKNSANMFVFRVPEDRRPEYAYLQGNFSVQLHKSEAEIVPEQKLSFGDLAGQGLPFYWGSVRYETQLDLAETKHDLLLELPDVEGVREVFVNGTSIGTTFRREAQYFISRTLLKPGKNQITIRLWNTAQNFFGPHRKEHQRPLVWNWHIPGTYEGDGTDCNVASFGVLTQPVIKSLKDQGEK